MSDHLRVTDEAGTSAITPEQFRARLGYEDGLLYARFNLVLVVNGFAAVAVGFNQPIESKILLAFIMVMLNTLGAIAVWKTEMVIAALTKRFRQDHPSDPIENIVQGHLGKPGWLRPNQILCRLFPVILTLGWICGLVFGIVAFMCK